MLNRFSLGVAALQLFTTAALLTLAAAPFGIFFLAWFGLAPWLIATSAARTNLRAACLGWFGGVIYFSMNVWWLWTASIPGTVVLIGYFSLYWGAAAWIIRRLQLIRNDQLFAASSPFRLAIVVIGIAMIWTASEWLRCNVVDGFPWLPLGATQTPLPSICQIADWGGPAAVTFWVALLNALVAVAWARRRELSSLKIATMLITATTTAVCIYGHWRLSQAPTTPGPRIVVLQSNFTHLRGGTATAAHDEIVQYFIAALEEEVSSNTVDLAVLPEAAFPPINEEARRELASAPIGRFLESTYQQLTAIADQYGVSLLLGGNAVTHWTASGKARVGRNIRNSAYFFTPRSTTQEKRYDKVHLVPFSERAPFAGGPDWLRRIGLAIAANRASQPLTPGDLSIRSFTLVWTSDDGRSQLEFVTPICLEIIDPRIMNEMMHSIQPGKKRIGLIANLSNDGWFARQEKAQHLQTLAFRAIEHRVPIVRSSNTGISAIVDSSGRVRAAVPPGKAGTASARIELDDRVTVFSQYGEWFAVLCLAATGAALIYTFVRPASPILTPS